MNKKQIAILGTVVMFLGNITTAAANGEEIRHNSFGVNIQMSNPGLLQQVEETKRQAELDVQRMAEEQAANKNKLAIENRIKQLKKYVNRTAYVFSGSSPSGWDCSGLTRWFYEGLGIELDHSASKQARYAGVHVDTPILGDIVAFKHLNSEKYYHVGIYIGDNKVIHAKKPGTRTEMIELTDGWFAQSEISFIRVIENQ